MSGDSKFDTVQPVTLNTYKYMFSSVSDVLSWNDSINPASSCRTMFSNWKNDAETTLDSVISDSGIELTTVEEEGLEAARQVSLGIIEKFLEKARASGWREQAPEVRRQEVERILSLPQIPQRTAAWYEQGRSVLTASEFSSIFGSPRAIRQLAFTKVGAQATQQQQTNRLACLTCEMGPFDWGIRFEPVVKQILAKQWGAKIIDSGRLIHPSDPLLAASPDGFIIEANESERIGRLIEIKCPISREVGVEIPFEYWCQMQIQMEVTGIEECEYVEVKLDSISPKKLDLSGAVPDGYVWLFQNSITCQMSYVYTETERDEAEKSGLDLIETIPWRMNQLYNKTVIRDKSWFQSTEKARQDFWDIVRQARCGDIQPFEVKSKAKVVVTKEPECRIVDDVI